LYPNATKQVVEDSWTLIPEISPSHGGGLRSFVC
jgi:hypothetical protein